MWATTAGGQIPLLAVYAVPGRGGRSYNETFWALSRSTKTLFRWPCCRGRDLYDTTMRACAERSKGHRRWTHRSPYQVRGSDAGKECRGNREWQVQPATRLVKCEIKYLHCIQSPGQSSQSKLDSSCHVGSFRGQSWQRPCFN